MLCADVQPGLALQARSSERYKSTLCQQHFALAGVRNCDVVASLAAQHMPEQHSTGYASTAQHSTTQHNTAHAGRCQACQAFRSSQQCTKLHVSDMSRRPPK